MRRGFPAADTQHNRQQDQHPEDQLKPPGRNNHQRAGGKDGSQDPASDGQPHLPDTHAHAVTHKHQKVQQGRVHDQRPRDQDRIDQEQQRRGQGPDTITRHSLKAGTHQYHQVRNQDLH